MITDMFKNNLLNESDFDSIHCYFEIFYPKRISTFYSTFQSFYLFIGTQNKENFSNVKINFLLDGPWDIFSKILDFFY